jgi:hydroxymethylpyrimidine/phosphomethylpyrimidine kinase
MDSRDATLAVIQTPVALTIAGSDSGAGAGIQADLRTFAAFGVYGVSVVTAEIVAAQCEAVLQDFDVRAIKIGMLANGGIVDVVAEQIARTSRPGSWRTIVYDPVTAASSGDPLAGAGFVEAIHARLLPLVDCLTPNLGEAAALLRGLPATDEAEMARQGRALLRLGPRAILMKGGHLEGDAVDLLVTAEAVHRFAGQRIASPNLHGTGCTLSSAIAAQMALGRDLPGAVAAAKAFVRASIERGRDLRLGGGSGPLIQAPLAR